MVVIIESIVIIVIIVTQRVSCQKMVHIFFCDGCDHCDNCHRKGQLPKDAAYIFL